MGKKKNLTGSELGLRKHYLGCECGEVGELFISNGEFLAGHFCKLAKAWTLRKAPGLTEKELWEAHDRKWHMGQG